MSTSTLPFCLPEWPREFCLERSKTLHHRPVYHGVYHSSGLFLSTSFPHEFSHCDKSDFSRGLFCAVVQRYHHSGEGVLAAAKVAGHIAQSESRAMDAGVSCLPSWFLFAPQDGIAHIQGGFSRETFLKTFQQMPGGELTQHSKSISLTVRENLRSSCGEMSSF